MKILTICPSIYPDKLINMMDSFLTTRSEHTSIRICYEKKSITKIFNEMFQKYPDFDFYHLSNDDTVYKTINWDIMLAKKGKITHGRDSIPGGYDGQFLMIDGNIVRALGWLQMPTLERYCGDVVWRFIGNELGILEYVPEVEIEHIWEGADASINEKDMGKFAQWLQVSQVDINKIRRALNGL